MMDGGWRRCGDYYYKPNLQKSCCLWYTIRVHAQDHKTRKSHKKALKRWKRFLNGELDINGKPTTLPGASKPAPTHPSSTKP